MTKLTLIDLDQELEGQRRFISCWVSQSDGLTFVVDPGPPATAQRLIAALEGAGVRKLDLVLLTHIHLDHGGATSELLKRWPGARVVSQPKGRGHLAAPERLWQGSRQVLGHAAEVYGEPQPVPETALAGYEAAEAAGIRVIPTPGHAPHHISFLHEDTLYLGEAAGTFSTLGKGSDTEEYYLRPATPPRFFPAVAFESIERMMALDPFPDRLCFAHHGQHTGDGLALLRAARAQHESWLETCREVCAARGGLPSEDDRPALLECFDAIAAELLRRDPHYARMKELPADIQGREQQFTRQTLWGMTGHLRAGD